VTTRQQSQRFAEEFLPSDALETAVDWIKENLSPDDVFETSTLAACVQTNLSIDDVFPEKDVLAHVRNNYHPEDVFDEADLENWAQQNGFSRD
jgi:hypothetical protein